MKEEEQAKNRVMSQFENIRIDGPTHDGRFWIRCKDGSMLGDTYWDGNNWRPPMGYIMQFYSFSAAFKEFQKIKKLAK